MHGSSPEEILITIPAQETIMYHIITYNIDYYIRITMYNYIQEQDIVPTVKPVKLLPWTLIPALKK